MPQPISIIHTVCHTLHASTNEVAAYVLRHLEGMPFAQGLVVWVTAGLSAGYVFYADLPMFAVFVTYATYAVVLILGASALWLLLTDRRRKVRALSRIAVLAAAALLYSGYALVDSTVSQIIYDISVILVVCVFFFVALHSYVIHTSSSVDS